MKKKKRRARDVETNRLKVHTESQMSLTHALEALSKTELKFEDGVKLNGEEFSFRVA